MKVLIVSKDRALLRHLSRFLTTFGYETTQVADYPQAIEMAGTLMADLMIVDGEPDIDEALEYCRTASGREGGNHSYTLLMVASHSAGRLGDALESGVDDFLTKPIVYGEVLMRLRAGIRSVEFQRRMRKQRRREPVTGLLSCAALHARLGAAGSAGTSRSGPFACVLIEVDFIDRVARAHGQAAEEAVLQDVADLLDRLCKNDRADLAHFGGGEFCVVLPGDTTDRAAAWADTVRSAIVEQDFLVADVRYPLTLSVGIGGSENKALTPEAVLGRARLALQSARASGGDCVVRYGQFADEEKAWKELAAPGRLFERTVARDVMLPVTVVIHGNDEIGSVDSLLRQTRLANVVALDDRERLAGTVAATDVADYLQASGDPLQPVSRVMIRDVKSVDEETHFADLIGYFAGSDAELLVVVDDGHPTGIVTTASLASLSQAPESPEFCTASPSMESGYLKIVEPLEPQGVGEAS